MRKIKYLPDGKMQEFLLDFPNKNMKGIVYRPKEKE
jgi:hypothetical protein